MIIIKMREPSRELIGAVVEVLERGGLVIYPTETVYGLGCDATREEVVGKIYEAKIRPRDKPVSVALFSIDDLWEYAIPDDRAEQLAREFLPGPLTLILRSKGLPKILAPEGKTGFRIPDHPVAREIIEAFGKPITSTSANLSGGPDPITAEDAIRQIGDRVDLIVDSGPAPIGKPSTVIDLTLDPPVVLREGAIPIEELRKVLGDVSRKH